MQGNSQYLDAIELEILFWRLVVGEEKRLCFDRLNNQGKRVVLVSEAMLVVSYLTEMSSRTYGALSLPKCFGICSVFSRA
ncbi:MAG: hypothetical protein ACR2GN_03430 [Bacteroidia bacterium]